MEFCVLSRVCFLRGSILTGEGSAIENGNVILIVCRSFVVLGFEEFWVLAILSSLWGVILAGM
jgi:hypothetical protein